MLPVKEQKQNEKSKQKHETDSLQGSDFWLLLFVAVVTLLFVFNFYS